MRIFLAGATGVIGSRLLPLLLERGHDVAAMTRTPRKSPMLRSLGAEPIVCDVYDAEAVIAAVGACQPEMVIHLLTDLPDTLEDLATAGDANARMRREGTRNLLSAAAAAGTRRVVAQSVAWEPSGDGAAAKQELERRVIDFGGLVIRYGQFYGPSTYYPLDPPAPPRIHVDDAAGRTVDALTLPSQIIVLTEDPESR